MKSYGRTSLSEFLGDLVVYRNLAPMDERLPGLSEVAAEVGLEPEVVPRKSQTEYARVIVHLLGRARVLDLPGTSIERLLYVGDTRLNDGTAFGNICRAGGWPGAAFIGAEKEEPAHAEVIEEEGLPLFLANRWEALGEFDRFCRTRGLEPDAHMAVIVDLDKTALGARGRNDRLIDAARLEAVRVTLGELLGDSFNAAVFEAAYESFNQSEFHPFTSDNQDYLAYICLIVGSGLQSRVDLEGQVRAGQVRGFEEYIGLVEARSAELPAELRRIHAQVLEGVRRGDPTPFKSFRYNEYRTTTERMGHLPDGTSAEDLLAGEITITQEVRAQTLAWREQGALVFGLSDKPDEASVPGEELAAAGAQPIHRVESHAVGT